MLIKKDFVDRMKHYCQSHDAVYNDIPYSLTKGLSEIEYNDDADIAYFVFNLDCDDPSDRKRVLDYVKAALENAGFTKDDIQYYIALSVDGDEEFIEVSVEYDGDELNENYEVTVKNNLKDLANGTKVRISGDTLYDANGDYVFLARKGKNAALCKVGSNDRMDEFWVNSTLDRRIYDMMDKGATIEVMDGSVEETTTVGNIAPTVDYIGHVRPAVYPDLPDNDTPEIYVDKDEKEKDANKAAGDDAWVSPIGKLVAGESVRKVIGAMVGLED